MQMTVGMAADLVDVSGYVDVGSTGQVVLIQNLGPGIVYVDFKDDVTPSTGLRLDPDDAYEYQRAPGQELYAVSSVASTDLRFIVVG